VNRGKNGEKRKRMMKGRRRRINVHPTNKTESIREDGGGPRRRKRGRKSRVGGNGKGKTTNGQNGELVNGERREISYSLTDE
jgi:hypothetical protein